MAISIKPELLKQQINDIEIISIAHDIFKTIAEGIQKDHKAQVSSKDERSLKMTIDSTPETKNAVVDSMHNSILQAGAKPNF